MSIFDLIENTEDLGKLQKIYNNLPGNVDLLSSVSVKHTTEDLIKAKFDTRSKINELKGY